MKVLVAALLCALAPAQEDERLKRIVERIEKEIQESHRRTLRDIREIVRAEIRTLQGTPAPAPAPARKRVLLGITAGDLTEADRQAAGVTGGVKVEAVRGPAEKAGLKAGDVLVEIDGKPATESLLREIVEKRAPGDVVEVGVARLKKRESFKITLGERKD